MTNLVDTGRIKGLLDDDIRDTVFGTITQQTVENELNFYAHIDFAHVKMLSEQGLLAKDQANALLAEIGHLYTSGFAPLLDKPADRGVYMAYENHLMETLGGNTGGMLQAGRSRNDLNATVFKLRLRAHYERLFEKSFFLIDAIERLRCMIGDSPCPSYTHYQPAFPCSFGHYLNAIKEQLSRDIYFMHASFDGIDLCPLGACAGGGTTLAIDQSSTSRSLGFNDYCRNSIDAVASRDLCTKGASSIAQFSTSISRLAADLIFWCGSEVAMVNLPDNLVGSSSNMPQKRNPFLLEMIKGRCSAIIGDLASSMTATQWTPFSNSVSVSGESTKHIWSCFRNVDFILDVMSPIISGLTFNQSRALNLMERGFVDSVYFAERNVIDKGMPFRQSHHLVGEMVNHAVENTLPLRSVINENAPMVDTEEWFSELSASFKYGSGPGAKRTPSHFPLEEVAACVNEQIKRWSLAHYHVAAELNIHQR